MKKKRKIVRTSKLERIAIDTATYHAHASTADIQRQHIVLSCQSSVVESEIVALQAKMVDARLRRAGIEAQLTGLAAAVARR